MINKYPYTDFNEFNLDWVVRSMRDLKQDWSNFKNLNSIKYAGAWDITEQYEAYTLVEDDNKVYMSIKPVPAGISLTNTEYWEFIEDYGIILQVLTQKTDGFVTPEMFGAAGDGLTDDTNAVVAALNASDTVLFPNKYYVTETIKLKHNQKIKGENRNTSVIIFPENVNGIQINHSTTVEDLTIEYSGDAAAIYMYTPENYSYALSSIVQNVRLVHSDNDKTKGAAIKLVAEKIGSFPDGAYNMEFSDIDIRNNVKYGVQLLNKVQTTSASEAWMTDIKFFNVFVNSADTAFYSDWEDVSGSSAVPHTGNASVNASITLIHFDAQYVANVTKCYMNMQNVQTVNLISCTPFDHYHLRYDHNLPMFVFNATTNMCKRISLGSMPELDDANLDKYISYNNATTFFQDIFKTIVEIEAIKNKMFGNIMLFDKSKLLRQLPNGFDRDTVWTTFPELIFENSIQYCGLDSNGYFVFGYETGGGGGAQLALTASTADSPLPRFLARIRYNSSWGTDRKLSMLSI